jgi:hypothetical protein
MSDNRLVPGILEIKDIPLAATGEINRLFSELQTVRATFAEYVKTVRLSLGIPELNSPDQMWDLSDNAVFFLRLDTKQGPLLVPKGVALPASEQLATAAQSADAHLGAGEPLVEVAGDPGDEHVEVK